MNWIDFQQLPDTAGGFSDLFLDYINNFEMVQKFYATNFRNNRSYEGVINDISTRQPDRASVAEALTEQNRHFGSPASTFEHINLLAQANTFAVVTGQQVGLFGGPLYTVFKTITAVKLAFRLKEIFPEHNFVPVFWIEGEDHDFAEMNHVNLLDRENAAVNVSYLPGGALPERNLGPIGELTFDGSLEATYKQVSDTLPKTEFTDPLLQRLKGCYAPGRTFNEAFVSWMNFLFAEQGLVFISANHPRLKRLLSPLFVKELSEFPSISQMVITQSAELEGEYHAQIKAKSINLFLFHKGGRYLIEPREHDFSLKGTRHFLSGEELLAIARDTPELLSTNVILRPIAQDMLLPTVAYVAGPSEVAYHAQLRPVYEALGMVQPVVYPRASASFVEERLVRAMEKYDLQVADFFGDINRVTARVVEQISEVKVDDIFGTTTKRVHDAMNELRFGLKQIDQTLLGALDGVIAKIDTNIGVLREKSVAAQKRRNDVAVRQIEKAAQGILPNGSLQEREISILYYMNKYGPDLVGGLLQKLDINGFKHQLLTQ